MPNKYDAYNNNQTIDTTPTIQIVGAYEANDVIGGLQTIVIDTSPNAHGCTLRRVNIVDDDSEGAAMTLYIFDGKPSTIVDAALFAPTTADLLLLVDTVTIAAGDYVTVNSNDYVVKSDLNIDIDFNTAKTFYVYAVVTGTPTYTAIIDLSFRYTVWVD